MAEFTYDVVRYRGTWRVLRLRKHSAPYADQDAAIKAALKRAKEDFAAGREAEVRLIRTDGQIVVQPLPDGVGASAPIDPAINDAPAGNPTDAAIDESETNVPKGVLVA